MAAFAQDTLSAQSAVPAQRRPDEGDGWQARARTHKVQIRPEVTTTHWFWICLTCGPGTRSDASYATHSQARAAACCHDTEVDVLR